MNTTTSMALTAGVVTVGRWAEGKTVSFRIVMGASFVALTLAAMSNGKSAKLASQMATLILVGAFLRYAISIFTWTGISAGAGTAASAAGKAGQ
jgi:hypothetical protein